MASIREVPRKDGSIAYTVLFRIDGRQSTITFDDEPAAEAFKAAINVHGAARACAMYNINPAPRRRGIPEAITVEQWIRNHIDHLTGVEQTTIDKYNEYLANDIAPVFGNVPLAALSEEDIAKWVKRMETTGGRKGTGHSSKTLRNKYGFLSGALNAAVGKHITANPAAGRRLPRDGEDSDEMRMLTYDEFETFYEAFTPHWQPIIEFMVSTGLRWGEVSALQPKHVDRRNGTVIVRQAWKYSTTKGYYLGPPKTKRSRRTVDVPHDILAGLQLGGKYVFMNTIGGPIRYSGFKERVWDRAVLKAKLPDPAPTPHDLRHTYASWQLAKGTPIHVVSRQLGHESIKITVDTYGHLDRSSSKAAADVMANILRPRSSA